MWPKNSQVTFEKRLMLNSCINRIKQVPFVTNRAFSSLVMNQNSMAIYILEHCKNHIVTHFAASQKYHGCEFLTSKYHSAFIRIKGFLLACSCESCQLTLFFRKNTICDGKAIFCCTTLFVSFYLFVYLLIMFSTLFQSVVIQIQLCIQEFCWKVLEIHRPYNESDLPKEQMLSEWFPTRRNQSFTKLSRLC